MVLLVEDDQDIRDAVSESLEDAGYAVAVAADGAVAIGALRAARDLPCLILLDLMMPVMDGEHFLREMQQDPRLSGLPVVLLSADGYASSKATALGARSGLRKPVQLDELLAIVSRYCPRTPAGPA